MLQRIRQLEDCSVFATDGEIGNVRDVYFDDEKWVLRYLVVVTGGWLTGRKVLLSPYGVTILDIDGRKVFVNLTSRQVRDSPDVDTDKPVSRQYERKFHAYYGYPDYRPGPTFWPFGAIPTLLPPDPRFGLTAGGSDVDDAAHRDPDADQHLRSAREVVGYHIQAVDESIGHAEDVLFDTDSWAILFVVVDTRDWWPGKRVLVSPEWIEEVDWPGHSIKVAVTREQIRLSPEYDQDQAITAEHLQAVRRYYARLDWRR
jgi:uncharacterized protein YrrD